MNNESNATPHQAAEPAPSEREAFEAWFVSEALDPEDAALTQTRLWRDAWGDYETIATEHAWVGWRARAALAASPAPRAVAEPGEHLAVTLDMLDFMSGYPDFTEPEGELIATAIADAIAGKRPQMLINLGYLAQGLRPPELSAAPAPTPSEDARDAARYRHMRATAQFRDRNGPGLYWYLPRFLDGGNAEKLDAAIDAARLSADGAVGELPDLGINGSRCGTHGTSGS